MNILSKVSGSCLQHYGEVPEYLQKRNEEELQAQDDYERFVRERREQAAMKNLSEERRQAILKVKTAAQWQFCPLKKKQQGIIWTSGMSGGTQEIKQ